LDQGYEEQQLPQTMEHNIEKKHNCSVKKIRLIHFWQRSPFQLGTARQARVALS
jgi:hypothetical protein